MENVKEKNSTLKKVGNIAFYVVLAIVLIYALFALFSSKDDNKISFFGITSLAVQTDSMTPTFDEGDLIFIDTSFDAADFVAGEEDGTVITYYTYDSVNDIYYYNTHRIVDTVEVGGVTRYITRGDKYDGEEFNDERRVVESEILGVWTGRSISNFGSFADGFTNFIKSSLGFFLLIVLPAVAFLAYEVFRFVKIYAEYNTQKDRADRVKLQEEAIAEAKRQLEEEQKNKE